MQYLPVQQPRFTSICSLLSLQAISYTPFARFKSTVHTVLFDPLPPLISGLSYCRTKYMLSRHLIKSGEIGLELTIKRCQSLNNPSPVNLYIYGSRPAQTQSQTQRFRIQQENSVRNQLRISESAILQYSLQSWDFNHVAPITTPRKGEGHSNTQSSTWTRAIQNLKHAPLVRYNTIPAPMVYLFLYRILT